MGLYLCVFSDDDTDDEVDGVVVGGYDDFNELRRTIAERLEPDGWGSRFPVVMSHPDSDGVWSVLDAGRLEAELSTIAAEFAQLPPVALAEGWQQELGAQLGLQPASLRECFIDVDGEPLIDRLVGLSREAQRVQRDIWFQ
jgi:hypothetical protein